MISWYAVYTRPQSEVLALENLLRQGYQAYLPRYRTQLSHARRLRSVLRPLFPRYLFAGLDRSAMRWRPILSTIGVSDVVRAGDEPLPVAAAVVERLREEERDGGFDRVGRSRPLQLGELVRISAGACEEMIGRLIELRGPDRVVVLLDLLGRPVRAQVAAAAVNAA